ncbi:amidoligase family protein [Quadrisphaera sp. INWT6]|uniref:amidoligase family protein n=1 Tax=Quadrisphaera sp. INWT6 TaxID=2596917 RepID=UPI0019D6888D|nr:amidoligase family protein [Quadrisphaera sp. INWT6]
MVTPPLLAPHAPALEALLAPARELGFTVPYEAAVHLHVDGARFRDARAFTDLVRLFANWGPVLRAALGTNPACTRLGPLSPALVDLAEQVHQVDAGRARPSWRELQRAARATDPVKFCDLNITALMNDAPARDTVEVRILGGSDDGQLIAERASLVHDLLERCGRGAPLPVPPAESTTPGAAALANLCADPAAAQDALRELAGGGA